MPTLTVKLLSPHNKQKQFQESKAKRKVIIAGRRAGKTTGVVNVAILAALKGKRVLEAAPRSDQTNAFWESVKDCLKEPLARNYLKKRETIRAVDFPTGGRIRAKTAFDADALRSDYADLLILDEFALMDPATWYEVGAPMLLDNGGDAVFITSPRRKNHAFHLFNNAINDKSGRWEAFKFTSHDNPHLSKDALEEITSDMTDEMYRQEIMAEFLDNEGSVFRNITFCMQAPLDVNYRDHLHHDLYIGVDWGRQNDWTAISVGCAQCKVEVFKTRYNKIDYVIQSKKLMDICSLWKPKLILAEANSIGDPLISYLTQQGIAIKGFQTTAVSKPQLIENLALALDRGEWQFQADPIWQAEMESYERIVSPQTGRSFYSAPTGVHDDTVIARALMIKVADAPRRKQTPTVREIL